MPTEGVDAAADAGYSKTDAEENCTLCRPAPEHIVPRRTGHQDHTEHDKGELNGGSDASETTESNDHEDGPQERHKIGERAQPTWRQTGRSPRHDEVGQAEHPELSADATLPDRPKPTQREQKTAHPLPKSSRTGSHPLHEGYSFKVF